MRSTILIIAALLTFPCLVHAQNVKVVRDLRSRTYFGIEKEIIKNLEVFGELELGLEQDLEKIGKIHGEFGTSYAPLKFLSFEAKYRYTKNRKNYKDEYKYTNTLALAAEADYKFDRFKAYYRIQFQNVDDESSWFNSTEAAKNIVRNRVKLKYNIKGFKLDPFVSTELYASHNYDAWEASKLKTYVGCEYKIKDVGVLKFYYRNDRELVQYLPYAYHTLGLGFTLKL